MKNKARPFPNMQPDDINELGRILSATALATDNARSAAWTAWKDQASDDQRRTWQMANAAAVLASRALVQFNTTHPGWKFPRTHITGIGTDDEVTNEYRSRSDYDRTD
jgi:hypothetical protein